MINVLSKTTLVRCCCKDAIKTLKKSSAIQIVARTKMNVTSSIDEENIFRPIIGMTGNEGILHHSLLLYSSGRSMRHWFCLPKSLRNNCHHAALKRKFTTNSLMGTDNDESDLLSDSFCPAEKKPLQLFSAIDRDYMSIDDVTQILNESLCEDLCVIKIDEERTKFHYVDYFVIVSGRSVRHLKSMAFEVCAKVIEAKVTVRVVVVQKRTNLNACSFQIVLPIRFPINPDNFENDMSVNK